MEIKKSNTTKEFAVDLQKFQIQPMLKQGMGGTVEQRFRVINEDFFYFGLMALDNEESQAHCVLYNNINLKYLQKPCLQIGFFYDVKSKEAMTFLLQKILDEAKGFGADYILGPINGSTWDSYRQITEQRHPFLGDHPIRDEQLSCYLDFGFTPIANYYSSIDYEMQSENAAISIRANELEKAGMKIRSINKNNYDEELRKLFDFNLLAFQKNFMYSPISWEQFKSKYTDVLPIINEVLVLIAEDEKANLVGFVFCYDNHSSQQEELVVKTIARHPDARWKGLGQVLAQIVVRKAKAQGYKAVIHAFLIDDGMSTSLSKSFSGNVISRYALYALELK